MAFFFSFLSIAFLCFLSFAFQLQKGPDCLFFFPFACFSFGAQKMLRTYLRRSLNSATCLLCSSATHLQRCSTAATLLYGRPIYATHVRSFLSNAAFSSFCSPLTVAIRGGASVARKTAWRAAASRRTWRQAKRTSKAKATTATLRKHPRNTGKTPKTASRRTSQRLAVQAPAQRRRRRRQPRKLSPYQRQTERYNKRVVAIARLWKEQRKGVEVKKKSLASRLA